MPSLDDLTRSSDPEVARRATDLLRKTQRRAGRSVFEVAADAMQAQEEAWRARESWLDESERLKQMWQRR